MWCLRADGWVNTIVKLFLFFCNKGAVLFMDILTVMVRSHPMTLHGATFTMWQHYVVDSLCGLTMNSCGIYMCRDFVNMLQVKIMMMFLFYLNMYKCYKYCTVCDILMLFLSGLNEDKSELKDFLIHKTWFNFFLIQYITIRHSDKISSKMNS